MADRDILEVDVLIVGAGPSGMAAAWHLRQLALQAGMADLAIAVLEKGREVGAHSISGAVMDPRGMNELMPDWKQRGAPIEHVVSEDRILYLTKSRKFTLPITPSPLQNEGNLIISLSRFMRWFGGKVEQSGVDVFTGFAGVEMLMDGERVAGVRTGDLGIDKAGKRKTNYEPGIDIRAKITILAEGARGSLTKQLVHSLNLDRDKNPQVYALGVKEVWNVPSERNAGGWVIHTMGWPLHSDEFGGGFIYNMAGGNVSIGLVIGLDYHDPRVDPHERFQEFKTHPFIHDLLKGGALHSYGAKAIPEGGYWAQPQYYFDGGMIVGDSAGFLNSMRLKGIHLALKSGMLAAQSAFEALQAGDYSAWKLRRYEELVKTSWIKEELWRVRNFHQGFERGFVAGVLNAGLQMATGGRGLRDRYRNVAGHTRMKQLRGRSDTITASSGKLEDVYHSGTKHDEDQPAHLHVLKPEICHPQCTAEFGNPCRHFCPAAVYDMVDPGDGRLRLQINASNCVHCKACDIMDPYAIIDWVPPEGGGGPSYDLL